jgi:hypothetical protein
LGAVVLLSSFGASLEPLEAQSCIVTTPIGTHDDIDYSITVQADGKVVVGVTSKTSRTGTSPPLRYHAGLGLDVSFDTDGIATHPIWDNDEAEDPTGRQDCARRLHLDPAMEIQ